MSKDLYSKFLDDFFKEAKKNEEKIDGMMFNLMSKDLYIEWLEEKITNEQSKNEGK